MDLLRLQEVCATNYQQVLRLIEEGVPEVPAGSEVVILSWTLRPYSLHTWVAELHWQVAPLTLHYAGIHLRIHIYHDARMAEVVRVQRRQQQIPALQKYPNPRGQAADEKLQLNIFLGELLAFVLRQRQNSLSYNV